VREDSDLGFRALLMSFGCLYAPTASVLSAERAPRVNHRHLRPPRPRKPGVRPPEERASAVTVHASAVAPTFERHALSTLLSTWPKGRFLRAKLNAIRLIPRMLEKRRAVQRARRVSAAEIDTQSVKGWFTDKPQRKLDKW